MEAKEWFETWFDTPYYHQLYYDRNDIEAQQFISHLTQHISLPPQALVLDVACGKGRHSRYLAKLGFNTTGIDLSPQSIAAANTELADNLHFEVWDMRRVYRAAHFDLVVNLFSSFGYFEQEQDDLAAIQAMADNLKEGGILVMDYMNPEYIVKILKPRDIINRGELQFHIQKKIENGFIRKQIDFIANGEDHHYEESLKIIKPEQFAKLFKSAGLTITATFGNYDLDPFVPTSSPRQVIIAKK
jgi:SAM-dependent methyltransferase